MSKSATGGESRRRIRIVHRRTGTLLADGPIGWGITPFEGNLYISRKYLLTDGFRPNWVPGLCIYKFLYVWLDLRFDGNDPLRNAAWMYWLPNPLLPFIWFRVALARNNPEIDVEEY